MTVIASLIHVSSIHRQLFTIRASFSSSSLTSVHLANPILAASHQHHSDSDSDMAPFDPNHPPAWLREPIAPYTPLRLEDFPEDLRGLLASITENVNKAVQRARESAVSLREEGPAPYSMKESSFLAWKYIWRVQYALKGLGTNIAEELKSTADVAEPWGFPPPRRWKGIMLTMIIGAQEPLRSRHGDDRVPPGHH